MGSSPKGPFHCPGPDHVTSKTDRKKALTDFSAIIVFCNAGKANPHFKNFVLQHIPPPLRELPFLM